jgi:hypothetical protein
MNLVEPDSILLRRSFVALEGEATYTSGMDPHPVEGTP